MVKAIDDATDELEVLKTDVPLAWLKAYDQLSPTARGTVGAQMLPFDKVAEIAASCGVPHPGLTREAEVCAMLQFFHDLGVLCWFDEPELREIVVLDPKWIIDALTCAIRDFDLHPKGSSGGASSGDFAAMRDCKREWTALQQKGEMRSLLLGYLWYEAQFKEHRTKILRLMVLFGLAVPVPSQELLIVPSLVGMNATSDPQQDIEHADRHLSECLITFERSDAAHSAPLVADYSEVVSSGYLPRGLFNQLCAAALGWSLQTAPTSGLSLSSHSAKMHFGRHPIALLQRSGEQAVRLQLKKPGSSAVALRLRLQLLLDEVIRRRFPTIRARFHLHHPTSDGSLIEVKVLEEYGTEDVLEIKQQLSQWFPPETPPREYDVFVSYRQKQGNVFTFDSRFADMLADCLAAREKVVFLDKRWPSLQEGQALDTAFLLSMVNSKVVVPLVSWNAMRRMTGLTEESEVYIYTKPI